MEWSRYFDHTILRADATTDEIEAVCREAITYHTASVCINSGRVRLAASMLADSDVSVCTVVGFPLGAMSTMGKKMEALTAIEDGAQEVDMVMDVGAVKDGDWDAVKKDIEEVVDVCKNNTMRRDVTLKVILETCLLTDDEKKRACETAVEAGADFVKTSTGFGTGGASVADVALMRETVDAKTDAMEKATGRTWKRVRVKASGGIRNADTAREMIAAGADRLGTSATIAILNDLK